MMMKTSRLQELMSGSFFLLKKGANIFLTDRANSLKLGDFGCAAKIRAHTTVAGELQGLVGTQGSRIQRLESIDIRVETELAIGFVSFFFLRQLTWRRRSSRAARATEGRPTFGRWAASSSK